MDGGPPLLLGTAFLPGAWSLAAESLARPGLPCPAPCPQAWCSDSNQWPQMLMPSQRGQSTQEKGQPDTFYKRPH